MSPPRVIESSRPADNLLPTEESKSLLMAPKPTVWDPLVDLKFTQDELNEFVLRAHEANLHLKMHLIRYEALQMRMNAVEEAQRRLPKNLRHRFKHAKPLHRWFEFRKDLPKTSTGKIQRFRFRAETPDAT